MRAFRDRETGSAPVLSLRGVLSSSTNLLHRLKLDKLLDGHQGCVNTVHFSPTGELLLTGSDDLQVILWDWAAGEREAVGMPCWPGGHADSSPLFMEGSSGQICLILTLCHSPFIRCEALCL